jgi:hypothetical protein
MTERFGHNDVIARKGNSGRISAEISTLDGFAGRKDHQTVLLWDQNVGPPSGGYDHHNAL